MQVSIGPSPHLWFCAFKRASLAPKLQVSMSSSFICGFVHSQQRHYDQNCKSLWVPAHICGFCMQNNDFWIRITILYGSQASPAVLCMQTNVINIRITSLHETQHSSVVFACKRATFVSELQVSMGPRIRLLICECKTA